ncbi:hypothetical protein ABZX82_01670 [Streptomyces griseoflavus]|uniref:hypothetical protein n=1 Tax=Streptomyces griseoflavus TaxID=35619 RepID=UPI0033A2D4B4
MISPQPETSKVSLDTELRNAAAKLRILTMPVAEQHPGPWNVHNPNGYPQAVFSPAADVILCETLDEIDAPKPTAPYIAAMQPGVALALAELLDIEATVVAARIAEDGTDDYAADVGTDHLLTIARLINGEEAAR